MLDAFETRLADMLANALAGQPNLGPVGRTGATAGPAAGEVGIGVHLASFEPNHRVGDDRQDEIRQPGDIRLRPTLHLRGAVRVTLTAAAPPPPDALAGRERLVGLADRLLLALHGEDVRRGLAFQTGSDLGFELDSFRLEASPAPPEGTIENLQLHIDYGFAGRFWPVEIHPSGDPIVTIPTRLNVMPVRLPEQIGTRAGAPDLTVPVQLDLRATDGAVAVLAARLEGAAPAGALVGDGAPAPPGYTGFAVGPSGTVALVYQPPANLASRAEVRVETRLAHPDRPSIPLVRFGIEVLPS